MHEHLQKRLDEFSKSENLQMIGKISKGYSSEVFLVKKNGKKFALKIEKEKCCRQNMVEKEVQNLKLANSVKVGPKLFAFDLEKRIILMEFVDGITFAEYVLDKKPKKKELEKIIGELFRQARILDKEMLDHGQLAGKGANILISKKCKKPVIIDFEKASQQRRPHNETQLQAFFFRNPNSDIAKKIRGIFGMEI